MNYVTTSNEVVIKDSNGLFVGTIFHYLKRLDKLDSLGTECEIKLSNTKILSMSNGRDTVWTPVNSIKLKTFSGDVATISHIKGSLLIPTTDNIAKSQRDVTDKGIRDCLYNYFPTPSINAQKVVVPSNVKQLDRVNDYDSLLSMLYTFYGYYVCKGRYKKAFTISIKKPRDRKTCKHFVNTILKPLSDNTKSHVSVGKYIECNSPFWARQAKRFGFPHRFPEWFLNEDYEKKIHILRGVYTACGVGSTRKPTFYIYDKSFMIGLKRFIMSMGLIPSITIIKGREYIELDHSISMWFKHNVGSFDYNKQVALYSNSTRKSIVKKCCEPTVETFNDVTVASFNTENNRFFAGNVLITNV